MISRQKLVLIFGVLMLGMSGGVGSGQGAAVKCSSEECACEEALRQNTVEALEEFLRKYPHSVENQDSACAALAVPTDEEAPSAMNQPSDGGGTAPSGLSL
jgi:hypothetical protein